MNILAKSRVWYLISFVLDVSNWKSNPMSYLYVFICAPRPCFGSRRQSLLGMCSRNNHRIAYTLVARRRATELRLFHSRTSIVPLFTLLILNTKWYPDLHQFENGSRSTAFIYMKFWNLTLNIPSLFAKSYQIFHPLRQCLPDTHCPFFLWALDMV